MFVLVFFIFFTPLHTEYIVIIILAARVFECVWNGVAYLIWCEFEKLCVVCKKFFLIVDKDRLFLFLVNFIENCLTSQETRFDQAWSIFNLICLLDVFVANYSQVNTGSYNKGL